MLALQIRDLSVYHLCSITRSLVARRASQKVTQIFSEELCDISSWLITGKVETGEKTTTMAYLPLGME